MADRTAVEEMERILDEVFRDRTHATRRDVYSCGSAHIKLPAEILAHLNALPETPLTKREMVEAINGTIETRGERDTLGLLRTPKPVEPVEETPEAERAVRDEAPLDAMNPTPTFPPDPGAPERPTAP